MKLRAVETWLRQTYLRRIATFLGLAVTVDIAVSLAFADPISLWMPMPALVSFGALVAARSTRHAVTAVWVSALAAAVYSGLTLLGVAHAWFYNLLCLGVLAASARAHHVWSTRETTSSCWLKLNGGLVPIELVPVLECPGCGRSLLQGAFSALEPVELSRHDRLEIEGGTPGEPIVLMVSTDADDRHWLVPRR